MYQSSHLESYVEKGCQGVFTAANKISPGDGARDLSQGTRLQLCGDEAIALGWLGHLKRDLLKNITACVGSL